MTHLEDSLDQLDNSLIQPMSRRNLIRLGGVVGATAVLGPLVVAACSSATSVVASIPPGTGTVEANGINPATYVGGDGSFARYLKDGIRVSYEANPGNLTDPAPDHNSGWNSDLVLTALTRIGITKFTYIAGTFDSLIPGAQSSRSDMIMSDVHVTPERIKVIDYTTPIYWYGDILVVAKGNPLNIHQWADLARKTVGVVRGYDMAALLEQRHDLKALKEYPDDNSVVTDLVAGRIDVESAGDANFTPLLAADPQLTTEVEIVADYKPQTDPSYWTRYCFRKGENDINDVVSREFVEMFRDGTTLSILKRYNMGTRNLFVMPGA